MPTVSEIYNNRLLSCTLWFTSQKWWHKFSSSYIRLRANNYFPTRYVLEDSPFFEQSRVTITYKSMTFNYNHLRCFWQMRWCQLCLLFLNLQILLLMLCYAVNVIQRIFVCYWTAFYEQSFYTSWKEKKKC